MSEGDLQSSNAHPKAGSVRHCRNWTRKRGNDCRFDDETGAAADDSSDHERLSTNTVHDACLETNVRMGQKPLDWDPFGSRAYTYSKQI